MRINLKIGFTPRRLRMYCGTMWSTGFKWMQLAALLAIVPITFLYAAPRSECARSLAKFKTAIEKNDKENIAAMTQFPLENTLPHIAAKDRKEFLEKYPTVFNKRARQAILKSKPDSIVEEGICSLHYCVKSKECYILSFKEIDQIHKLIYLGPFGE